MIPTTPNRAVSCLLASTWNEDAVREAASGCRERLGVRPDLVLAFASSDYRPRLRGLIEFLRLDGQAPRILGGSAEGLFGVSCEHENASGLSLVFLSLPNTRIETFRDAAGLGKSRLLDLDPAGFLALAHPMKGGVQGPMREFNARFPGVSVTGGFVSGGPEEEDLFLFTESGPEKSDFIAVGFSGGVRIVPLVAQSCRPIGEPLVVTRSRSNVLQAIAGKKPYSVLEETFASLDEDSRARAIGNVFAGLAVREEVEDFGTGDFVIRRIVGTDLDEGKLVLASPPRVGQTLQFQLREPVVAESVLTKQCEEIVAEHGRPFAAFVCAGRGRGRQLYGEPNRDAGILEAGLGRLPLAGFSGNGEFAPVAGVNFRHDHSLCGALFYPEHSR